MLNRRHIRIKILQLLLANNSNGSFGVSPPLLPLPRITLILTVLISDAFELAKDSLLNKKALKSFNTLIELSK